MSARILDGQAIAAAIRDEVRRETAALASAGLRPGLAAVLAGNEPASEVYVRNKVKACAEAGLHSETIVLPESVTTEAMLAQVRGLNAREEIDGILVQLPLPKQVDAKRVLLEVAPEKDVDGFHPLNVGLLSTQREGLFPCTPLGCMEILRRSGIAVEGAEAVVVGRSDIVGKPMAMLLLNANATVTVCHSRTNDLVAVCRRAEILIAAIGQPGLITRDHVRPGATVLDVGINRVSDPAVFRRLFAGDARREENFARRGFVLAGDVHPEVAGVAGALTPVPGGVGPLTIAMLLSNTVRAARMRRGTAPAVALRS